ncbi:N-acetylmuramoyl-L-alanine amidase [Bacteroidales bacterium SW292]|nr:N-acetylmuramoyl-L-alanine amidase [Bacteroidales bacterium SW292]
MNRLLLLLFLAALPVLLSAQQATDKPRRGEGISTFLERNGRSGQAYYREFLELNRKRLKGKKELLYGVSYVLPPKHGTNSSKGKPGKVRTLHEPLFGKKLDEVKVTGNRLAGACFYVVSGHGGPDPGAIGRVGRHELHEDEYAYDVALRLARNLMAEGAEVRIIIQDKKDGIRNDRYLNNSKRETCMGDPIPLGQVARLQQRCDKINALYASDRKKYKYCRSIFLHVDSRGKRAQVDVFFYHADGSKYGRRLARNVRDVFEQKYHRHQPGRGFEGSVSARNLYVLNHSTPVALFVELGNIQNSFDQRRFVIADNRQALANWLMEGLVKDYGN